VGKEIFMKVVKTVRKDRTGKTRGLPLFFILYLLSFICLCLLAACSSPALEEALSGALDEKGEDGNEDSLDDGLYDGYVSHTSFVLDAVAGLPAVDAETNAAGKVVATLAVPETEGPWVPELDPDVEDNGLFAIVPLEEEGTYAVHIKDGPLPVGPYKAVLQIRNGAGKVYHRIILFSVARTPPPFKTAPQVFPYITAPGKNKLKVQWDELPRSAAWYQLYVGTSDNSAEAQPYGGHVLMTEAQNSVEITDLEGDAVEGGLPDGTTYYVWVRPGNGEGEGLFSAYGMRKTSDTLWRDFYKNEDPNRDEEGGEDFYCWDSFYGGKGGPTGDYYIITPPSEEHPGGTLQYGTDGPGEIVYHATGGSGGKSKWGEKLTGPTGVIIYKYPKSHYPITLDYQGVYYYGLGTEQTVGPPINTLGPNENALGRILCYFGNSYDLVPHKNPETATPEAAIDKFTLANIGRFIAFIATPWYRDYVTPRPPNWWQNKD
jgi:hypothetical protein